MARSLGLDELPGSATASVGVEALTRSYVSGFSRGGGASVGLEEELILVDPETLQPVEQVERVLAELADRRFEAEFRSAQLELIMPVSLTVARPLRGAGAFSQRGRRGAPRPRLAARGRLPSARHGSGHRHRPAPLPPDRRRPRLGDPARPAERAARPRRGRRPGRGTRGLQRRPQPPARARRPGRKLAVLRGRRLRALPRAG